MKKNNAFTLAEVLVTLIIIGIVAALTVRAIKKVSEERTYVASVKKAHEALSVAVKNAINEEGPIKTWSNDDKINYIKNRLNISGPKSNSYDIKLLNGNETSWGQRDRKGFVLMDGSYCIIGSGGIHGSGYIGSTSKIYFIIDINGKTAPNIIGIDVHGFWVASDGTVYPTGGGPETTTESCVSSDSGWGCTAKILREGKISW